MQLRLTQQQRTLVAFSYFAILVGLFKIIGGHPGILRSGVYPDSNIWFYSGAFMIILGTFLLEPYFTTPSNAIANSIVTLVALFGLHNKRAFYGYWIVFDFVIAIFLFGMVTIMSKDSQHEAIRRISFFCYWVVKSFGPSKVIFSVIYIFSAVSYFDPQRQPFVYMGVFLFWISVTFNDFVGNLLSNILKVWASLSKQRETALGIAIGCENEFFYRVEVEDRSRTAPLTQNGELVVLERHANRGNVGIIVDSKVLLNKSWLSIYLLQNIDGTPLSLDLGQFGFASKLNSIFEQQNLVYSLDISMMKSDTVKSIIETNPLYLGRKHFIGYVTSGTNINIMNFSIVGEDTDRESTVREGSILKTFIYGKETLFQIINGNTKLEHLENFDQHGFTIGIARKLGQYNDDMKELDVSKWMPAMFAPVIYAGGRHATADQLKEIAQNSIGRLPDTTMEIPIKDLNAIVTHNTAILGILGIGKSYLAYELVTRVVTHGVKVVCIDITNEYVRELSEYLDHTSIIADTETAFGSINAAYPHIPPTGSNPELNGNFLIYKQEVKKDLCQFLFGQDGIPESKEFERTKSVRIYNVDYHMVSKGDKTTFNKSNTDLTQAEKTRVIVSELFMIMMQIPLDDVKKAKVLLVFEEAHSLIPEWNSVAYEGDRTAANGTAKYILQGRKYGLGSLIVTQRTSNVSKSILNQCNTIFALRVFDDTGKTFLENYIGKDYADTLATLEERHAIVIGKGLKLKQPVIIQLNERKDFLSRPPHVVSHNPVASAIEN